MEETGADSQEDAVGTVQPDESLARRQVPTMPACSFACCAGMTPVAAPRSQMDTLGPWKTAEGSRDAQLLYILEEVLDHEASQRKNQHPARWHTVPGQVALFFQLTPP